MSEDRNTSNGEDVLLTPEGLVRQPSYYIPGVSASREATLADIAGLQRPKEDNADIYLPPPVGTFDRAPLGDITRRMESIREYNRNWRGGLPISYNPSTLYPLPTGADFAPSVPPPNVVNPLAPPTPTIASDPANPLAPTRIAPVAPSRPIAAVAAPAATIAQESLIGPSGNPIQTFPFLAQQRARFKAELDQNPELKRQLAAIVDMENPTAGVAVAESLFNRMAMTGGTIASGIGMGNPNSFYGPVRRGSIPGRMNSLEGDRGRLADRMQQIDLALNGSNVALGHTDQGSRGDPNYETGGVGVNWAGERFNDWGGDPTAVGRARQWRQQQQAQLGPEYGQAAMAEAPYDPSARGPTKLTPSSYPGPQIASAGASDARPAQGLPGQQVPGMGMPQTLNSAQLMAMMFAMSAQRASFRPITYDPWAISQIGRANPNIGQSLASLGTYTTRVGTKVAGPA